MGTDGKTGSSQAKPGRGQGRGVLSTQFSKHDTGKERKESEVAQPCPTLCDPVDCSPPGSSVYGILQARVLEWLPFPSPGDLPDPGIKPRSPTLQADALTSEQPGKQENKQVDGRVEGGGRMNETGEEE